jgi:hypothetical protein
VAVEGVDMAVQRVGLTLRRCFSRRRAGRAPRRGGQTACLDAELGATLAWKVPLCPSACCLPGALSHAWSVDVCEGCCGGRLQAAAWGAHMGSRVQHKGRVGDCGARADGRWLENMPEDAESTWWTQAKA